MGKIQVRLSDRPVAVAGGGGEVNINAAAVAYQSAGQIGESLKNWGLAEQKAQEELDVATTTTDAILAFASLENELKTINHKQVPGAFEKGAQNIESLHRRQLSSPYATKEFQKSFAQLKRQYGAKARSDARSRFVKEGVAALDKKNQGLLELNAQKDPEGLDFLLNELQMQRNVDHAVAAGLIDPVEGGKRKRQILSRGNEIAVLQMMSVVGGAVKAERALADPGKFVHLDPLARARLAKQASAKAESERRQMVADAEKLERKTVRDRKAAQERRTGQIMIDISAGKKGDLEALRRVPTHDQLRGMVKRQELTGIQAKAILTYQEQDDDPETDQDLYAELLQEAHELANVREADRDKEKGRLIEKLGYMVTRRQVKLDDYKMALRLIHESAGANFAQSDYKVNFDWLRGALGGVDPEFGGMLMNENPGERARRASALREYRQRTIGQDGAVNHRGIAEDVYNKYVNKLEDALMSEGRFPGYAELPSNKKFNPGEARARLKEAFDTGKIEPDMYNSESARLDRIERLRELASASSSSSKSIPTQEGTGERKNTRQGQKPANRASPLMR